MLNKTKIFIILFFIFCIVIVVQFYILKTGSEENEEKPSLYKVEKKIKKFKYETWEDIQNHNLPGWFNHGKFGLFIHWGIYRYFYFFTKKCKFKF
jgi:regulatory protein YycI of two-component signal transduction system YycFG